MWLKREENWKEMKKEPVRKCYMSESQVGNKDFEECINENLWENEVSDKEWILRCLDSWEHIKHYI